MGAQQNTPIGNTGITGPAANLQQASGTTNQMIQPYYVGPGQAGAQYSQQLQQAYQQANAQNQSIAPTFQDMFSKYVDVSNQQAALQSGKIGESLGSRGALYSSANLAQQAGLRQMQTTDLANQAAQFQTSLESQKQNAQQIQNQYMQNILQQQAGVASGEWSARESAMGLAYQDFVRRTGVPPFASAGAQWGAGIGASGAYAQ